MRGCQRRGCTTEQSSCSRGNLTYRALSQTICTVHRTSGHEVWTSAPSNAHMLVQWECAASQIETPVCTCSTTTHQFVWRQQQKCGAQGVSPMECRTVGEQCETPYVHPRHRTNYPGMALPRTAVFDITASPAYTNGLWSSLRLECVAKKYRPSPMLSFIVQSIAFFTACMAWRLWITKQSNGCSTPASRSSAA